MLVIDFYKRGKTLFYCPDEKVFNTFNYLPLPKQSTQAVSGAGYKVFDEAGGLQRWGSGLARQGWAEEKQGQTSRGS